MGKEEKVKRKRFMRQRHQEITGKANTIKKKRREREREITQGK